MNPAITEKGRGVPFVALAYLGATAGHLLFLKGLAAWLPLSEFGAVLMAASLMAALGFTCAALRASSATAFAVAAAAGVEGAISARFDQLLLRIAGTSLLAAVLCYLLPVATWFQLPSRWMAAFLPLLGGASILLGLAGGSLLGSGRDKSFALLLLLDPLSRCGLGALFVWLSPGTLGHGALIAILLGLVASILFARTRLPAADRRSPLKKRRGNSLPLSSPTAIAALVSLGMLLFLDLAIVRLTLDPVESARFTAVAVMSRFLILLPVPLSIVLVPAVVRRLSRREPAHPELFRTMGAALIIALLGLLAVNEFGGTILSFFLNGDAYGGLRAEFIRYSLAAATFALSEVLIFFGLALGRVSLALLPTAVLVVETQQLLNRGHSVEACIAIVQTMAIALLGSLVVVVLLPLLWSGKRR